MSDVAGAIYLVQDDKRLVEMTETPYDSEDLLQSLPADYPHLLAGEQINPGDPRRWLLVSREIPLPSDDSQVGQWSVDHLFLDQEGVPTIVEVKRSTDTRIRREVVGQVLEYAANAVVYWPVERLRDQFDLGCGQRGLDPEEEILRVLGPGADADQLWQTVQTNLQAGRVRLVFVADQVPLELERIVEFLGTQMNPAEVFAIEVRQFVGQGLRALVPRLVGGSTQRSLLSPREKRQWDEASFIQELTRRRGPASADVFRQILAWSAQHSLPPIYGSGIQEGSYIPGLRNGGIPLSLFIVYTNGGAQIQFGTMQTKPPFDDEAKRREILDLLNRVPGVSIPEDRLSKYPSIPLSALVEPASLEQFLAVFDWAIEEIRRSREVIAADSA